MIVRGGRAVHLDTSFLIRALVPGSTESNRLRGWLRERRPVVVSALVWGELLCGPLGAADEATARRIASQHAPVGTDEAEKAAGLFNLAGRRRGGFSDCIIAGTAIVAGAELATCDAADFERFVGAGLKLAD